LTDETFDEEKYATGNVVARWLIARLAAEFVRLLREAKPRTVLDVGCGGGHFLQLALPLLDAARRPSRTGGQVAMSTSVVEGAAQAFSLWASDLDETLAREAGTALDGVPVVVEDARSLARQSDAFDLVTCTEVLEHAEDPPLVLSELRRVTRAFCLLSVPNEPWFRLCALLRGRYLGRFGNKPGHLHTWSAHEFVQLAAAHFEIVRVVRPFPWVMVLCRT